MAFRSPRTSSRVLQCLEPLQGKSEEEKEIQAVGVANRGDLAESYWRFYLLDEDVSLKEKASDDLIIVFSKSPRPPVGRNAD